MNKAITTPEVKAKLEDFGLEVAPSDAASLAKFIEQEQRSWHALIKERKLSAE
jgi:tripartite-type tricarboxylate transporter receptor subunit TctC